MSIISAERFTTLKAAVKAECARRKYTGSVASYADTAYDFTSAPEDGVTIDQEHYEKIAVPLYAILGKTAPDPDRVVSEKEIAEMESQVATLANYAVVGSSSGCGSSCTGLCAGGCASGCSGCSGSCSGGCSGCSGCGGSCSNSCSGSCSGGCSSDGCTAECADLCGGSCTSCSGSCTGKCSGCGGNCSGGCSGGCGTACTSSCSYWCQGSGLKQ